jgi:small subunit ribosomal protein S9
MKGSGKVTVNGREPGSYFVLPRLAETALAPTKEAKGESFDITVKVSGGGTHAQAEAVRLGIARALAVFDLAMKPYLRVRGYLTRDPRAVERKKYGLKKARRAPQWAKR